MAIHVLEDGVFERVMNYELGKVQEYRAEREAKRTSAGRSRTYSQSKPSKSSLGSDDGRSLFFLLFARDQPLTRLIGSRLQRLHPSTLVGFQIHS